MAKTELYNQKKKFNGSIPELLEGTGISITSLFLANFAAIALGVVADSNAFKPFYALQIVSLPLGGILIYTGNHLLDKSMEKYDRNIAKLRARVDEMPIRSWISRIFHSIFCCC